MKTMSSKDKPEVHVSFEPEVYAKLEKKSRELGLRPVQFVRMTIISSLK